MKSLVPNLFDFDAAETTGQKLHFRVVEFFVVAYTFNFCWEWGVYIQKIETVLLPLGIANYIDVSFMFDHGISLINAAAITLLCVLGLARVWTYAYLGAMALFHLQYVSRYCLGEISHGSNLIGMSILGLGLAMVVFSQPQLRRKFTLGFLYFFLGLGYTSAGVCKLIGTGITWPDGRHLWLWMAERQVDVTSTFGAFDPNWIQQLILSDYHYGTLVLTFGLVAELCAVLMWWQRFRYMVIPALVGMHIGVALTMNIFFNASTGLLLLLGLPWPAMIDWLIARSGGLFSKKRWQLRSA